MFVVWEYECVWHGSMNCPDCVVWEYELPGVYVEARSEKS